MLPFGTENLTLVQRVEAAVDGRTQVSYAKRSLSGCSWRRKSVWKQNGARMERGEEIICRIPAGQEVPHAGDYLFRGDVTENIKGSADLSAALERHREKGAFRIASVADNTAGGAPLAHYAATGEGA